MLLEEILQYLAPLGPPPPLPPEPENILLIGARTPEALGDDTILFDLLDTGMTLNHNVTYANRTGLTANAALGMDIIIISESIGSGDALDLNTTFGNLAIPVIIFEAAAADDFGLTPGQNGGSLNVTSIDIVLDTDPIAEGLTNGPVAIYNNPAVLVRALSPTSDSTVVARYFEPGDSTTYDAILYYEPNDQMVDRVAPSWRGFFGPGDRTGFNQGGTLNQTAASVRMLENMINLFTPETGIVNSVDKRIWMMME
jgi:hypothetical protein